MMIKRHFNGNFKQYECTSRYCQEQKTRMCNVKLHKNRERIAMRFIKKAGTQTLYLFSSHVYKQD